MQLVDDVLAYALVVFRHYVEALVVVQRGCEVVDHQAVDPGADEADDDHTEGVDGESGAADDGTGNAHRGSDVEVQVLVHYFGQDIQTARRGVDAEHQCLGGAEQQHEAAEVEPRVTHDGCRAGDGVGVGKDVLASGVLGVPGQYLGPEVGQGAEDEGRVDGLGAELFVDEQERQYQQHNVDDHDEGTE